jgi:hypothetical protein
MPELHPRVGVIRREFRRQRLLDVRRLAPADEREDQRGTGYQPVSLPCTGENTGW